MIPQFSTRWYVVQTHPHGEGKAVVHLERQGFRTYLPRYLKRRRHARRTENVAAPLFPRYLFLEIDMEIQRWRSIQSTIGVSHLVSNGGEPASVSDRVINELRQNEDESGLIRLNIRPRFTRGEKVVLLDGAFSGCLGLFEGMTDRDRVMVLLDLLGRKVRVVLDVEAVAAS